MKIREFYAAIIANEANTTEVREHAQNELAKMDAQNEKRRNTPSKASKENALLIADLLPKMQENVVYTSAQVAEMMEVNTSKASALLRSMVANKQAHCTGEVKSANGKGKVKAYMLGAEVEGE